MTPPGSVLNAKRAEALAAIERNRARLTGPAHTSRPSKSSRPSRSPAKRRRTRAQKLAALVDRLAVLSVGELDRIQQAALQGGPGVPRGAAQRRLLLEAIELVHAQGGAAEPEEEPVVSEAFGGRVNEGVIDDRFLAGYEAALAEAAGEDDSDRERELDEAAEQARREGYDEGYQAALAASVEARELAEDQAGLEERINRTRARIDELEATAATLEGRERELDLRERDVKLREREIALREKQTRPPRGARSANGAAREAAANGASSEAASEPERRPEPKRKAEPKAEAETEPDAEPVAAGSPNAQAEDVPAGDRP